MLACPPTSLPPSTHTTIAAAPYLLPPLLTQPTVNSGPRSLQVLLSVTTSAGARTYFASGVAGTGTGTGLAFSITPGPVVFDDIYLGETYDARLEQPGWSACGFANATGWAPVVPAPLPQGAGTCSGLLNRSDVALCCRSFPASAYLLLGCLCVWGRVFLKLANYCVWWGSTCCGLGRCDSVRLYGGCVAEQCYPGTLFPSLWTKHLRR